LLIEETYMADSLNPVKDGKDLLSTRRSVRRFSDEPVPDATLWEVFEVCRYAPTSRNSQSYDFLVIRDRNTLDWLSSVRGRNSEPIGRAQAAVAVVADPAKSRRHVQDACIAAYHFLLSAWLFGLGTCWIAAMDRDDVKERLGVARDHYIATVTPLGYPAESPHTPQRRSREEIVRFLDSR
jgi:nitroreductase